MKYNPSVILLFILLFSCNSDSKNHSPSEKVIQEKKDALKASNEPNSFFDTTKTYRYGKFINLLNIEDIKHGFNGEQIRFFIEDDSIDSVKIISIRNVNNKWTCQVYFTKMLVDKKLELVSVNRRIESSFPASGWDVFFDRFKETGIYNIRDHNEIPNYERFDCTDGSSIIVERALMDKFHFFEYPCWEIARDDIKDIKSVINAISLIQNEFKFSPLL